MGWQDAPVVSSSGSQPAWMSAPVVGSSPAKPDPSFGEKARGVAEGAAHFLTGGAGALAGGVNYLASLAAGRGTADALKRKQATEEALTFQPRTQYGQEGVENLERPFHKLAEYGERAGDATLRATGSPALAAGARTVVEGAPTLLPAAPKALRAVGREVAPIVRPAAERVAAAGEERAAVRAAEEAPKLEKIEQAKKLGIRLAPSEAGGRTGKILEGYGGKIATEQDLSRANAKVINRKAGEDIGLSERQSLTPANIQRQKESAWTWYHAVRRAGRFEADEGFREDLAEIRGEGAQERADFPKDVNESIQKEVDKFNVESADAESIMSKIRSLRERASRNMSAPDSDKFELGLAQKRIATSMEDLVERRLEENGSSNIVANFRKAREKLAKIYNVEEALGPSGNVNAAVLARQLRRGVPLSGNLKAIAESYMEFPKVMRSVDAMGGHAGFSALDASVAGLEVLHGGPTGIAAAISQVAGRPLARMAVTSRPYQAVAIKPRPVTPSLVARTARRLAGPATLQNLSED